MSEALTERLPERQAKTTRFPSGLGSADGSQQRAFGKPLGDFLGVEILYALASERHDILPTQTRCAAL